MIYAINMLHGINFGVAYSVCSVYLGHIGDFYSNKREGINIKSTMQSIKAIIVLMAVFSGSLMWLPLYERAGARMVYIMGTFSLIPSALLLWYLRNKDQKLMNFDS